MAMSSVMYRPFPRVEHVAAAIEGKLYLWGGMGRDSPKVHDGPAKTTLTGAVDVLDLQVQNNYTG